ncbi:MAG: hypothetical protein ACRCXZ_06850 [Patescibacteria group bacterium]
MNITVFFAFTQDFYYQKYLVYLKNSYVVNEQYYNNGLIGVNEEINQFKLDLENVESAEDCSKIIQIFSKKTPQTIESIKTVLPTTKFKNSDLQTVLQGFLNEVGVTNEKINKINKSFDSYNSLKKNISSINSICKQYFLLKGNDGFVPSDLALMKGISNLHNKNSLILESDLDYFKNLSLQRSALNNFDSNFANFMSLDILSKNKLKDDYLELNRQFIINLLENEKLLIELENIKLETGLTSKYKEKINQTIKTIENKSFVENFLKISI